MKEILKVILYAGVPFGLVMGLFTGITNGLSKGILGGIFSGIIFGLVLSLFTQYQRNKFRKNSSEITMGKTILLDGGANHFIGREGVGGWLFLTPDEVIFKSHKFNVQNHKTIIPLSEIAEVKAVATAGFIPNGLHIIDKAGHVERFVVNNRKVWIQKLNDAISSMNNLDDAK